MRCLRMTMGRPAVLFLSLGLLYLALPTAHHSYDAVAYAMDVEHAAINRSFDRLWHDYHILYSPLAYALHAIGRRAGLHPLMTMQMMNALAGALLATLLAALLEKRTGNPLLGICGGLALGVCGSFWYYSTNAEPYVVSLLALLGLFAWMPADAGPPYAAKRVVLSAAAFGLAVGLHLSTIVLAPLVVAFLLLPPSRGATPRSAAGSPGGSRGARRLSGSRAAALFATIAGALIAAPYAYKWLRYSPTMFRDLWTDFFAPTNPVIDLHFLARPFNPAVEFLALLRGFAPSASEEGGARLQTALTIVPILLTCAAVAGAWRAVRGGRWRDLFPIACLLTMLLFFATYNLGDLKFTVFLAVFLVIAAFLSLGELAAAFPAARRWLWLLPLLVALLGAGNYAHFIRPRSGDDSNPDLLDSLLIRETTGPNDGLLLIGSGERNNLKVYVPYFGEREAVILDFLFNPGVLSREESLARVRRRIGAIEERGGRLWAIADIVESGRDTRVFLERNGLTRDDWTGLFSGFAAGDPVRRNGVPLIYPLRRTGAGPAAPRP